MFYRIVSSQESRIVSIDAGGLLVWSNSVSNVVCRIESFEDLQSASTNSMLSSAIQCEHERMSVRVPMRPVETPAIVSIYSDGWGNLVETWAVPVGEPLVMEINEDHPYSDSYYAYVHQDNCYTELYKFTNNETIMLDMDVVPGAINQMTGVIFGRQTFFSDGYLSNHPVNITGPSGTLPSITTDAFGRYAITNPIPGIYTLEFEVSTEGSTNQFSFELNNFAGTGYKDLYFLEPVQAMAPNIYLYPEADTTVNVTLDFPCGGYVTVSEPAYESGWTVQVDTNGIIDGQYGYLFYEASLTCDCNIRAGWLLDGSKLESEFRSLLSQYGLQGREIDDFIDYWIPVLQGSSWCAVYPQDPVNIIALDISPQPDSLLRTHFIVRALDIPVSIAPPEIKPFNRTGFVAVEWGVWAWDQSELH